MTAIAVHLVFPPPDWAPLLRGAVLALAACEIAVLGRFAARRWPAGRAAAVLIASVALGPLIAAARLIRSIAGGRAASGEALLRAGLRGTFAGGLVALALVPLPAGWPAGAVIALTAGAILWALRAYRRTTSPISRPTRALLLGLRILVILLVAGWAAGPRLAYATLRTVRSVVLVGVDTSASMARRDGATIGHTARLDAAKRALGRARAKLEELAEQADVRLFTFSGSARLPGAVTSERTWSELAASQAEGPSTAIGDALIDAMERYERSGRPIAAVVLLSDGCNNTADRRSPEDLAEDLGARGTVLHAVGAGREDVSPETKLFTIRRLSAPEQINAYNRLAIRVAVRAAGLGDRRLRAVCRFDRKTLGTRTFPASEAAETKELEFSHVPDQTGYHRVHVQVELADTEGPGEPETVSGRHRAGQLVQVVDRGMRILYIEGKIRYESAYIARALERAERLTVDRRVLLRPLEDRREPALGEDAGDWLRYHAILLGDVAPSHFSPAQLETIRTLVGEKGKGFGMIGGRESFSRAWAQVKPIRDLLPVTLAGGDSQIDREVRVIPTRAAMRGEALGSPIVRIGEPGRIEAAWEALDPLPGANRLGRAKPTASVLARTQDGEPLIVAGRYGEGRTLAIALDTTYRWVLTPKDTAGLQRRFWRQAALFLCAPRGNVWITTDRPTYDLRRLRSGAQVVHVAAGVEDASGRPVSEAPEERITLSGPAAEGDGGSRQVRRIELHRAGDRREGTLRSTLAEGQYTLTFSARIEGKNQTAEHRFEVRRRDLESLEVLADFGLLRRMAHAAGGRFVATDGVSGVLRSIEVASEPRRRRVWRELDPARDWRWALLGALIVLLCAEWAWRKRKGLV